MGTGYTRNDTSNNIADGNVINASDLDGEFDAVQAAFNGTTGHSHDGTSGEGPQIATGGLADNAVTTAKITDANVTTAKIADSNVTTSKIADANVTLAKMAANSVDSDQYVDGSIDRVHLAADIVDGTKIADDSINSEHYVDGSIDTAHIGNLQVTTAKIAADAIDGTKLADNAVDSEHYTDGSIDRVHLAADIIDGTKIADDVINSEHYVAGSIDAEHLASSSVTAAKVANDAVALGTKTTGNYVATITAGTGISGSSSSEGGTPTIALATAGAGAGSYGSTDDGTKIDTITLDAYGRVTAVATGATMDRWVLEDGDGTEVTITNDKEVKFVEGGGVDINWTDTSPGSDADPYDLTFTINTSVTAGNGLTGGGQLNASRTLNVGAGTGISVAADSVALATAGAGAGTYGSTSDGTKIDQITLDAYGRVTAVTTGATGSSSTTGTVTSVATGGGLTGGTITSSGTISHADTSSQASVNNSGSTFIQDITLDTYGHVTALTSATASAGLTAVTGTYTPTVTFSVNNSGYPSMNVFGQYVKLDEMVFLQVEFDYLRWNATGTQTVSLPFTSKAATALNGALVVGYMDIGTNNGDSYNWVIRENATTMSGAALENGGSQQVRGTFNVMYRANS